MLPEWPVRQTDRNWGVVTPSEEWLDVIDRCVPAFLRGLARDNAGVRGLGDLPAKRGNLVPDVLLRQGMRRRPIPEDRLTAVITSRLLPAADIAPILHGVMSTLLRLCPRQDSKQFLFQ